MYGYRKANEKERNEWWHMVTRKGSRKKRTGKEYAKKVREKGEEES